MKRALFYISIILLALALGYTISEMKPKKINKLLSIDTEYSFLMDEGQLGTILFYVNDEKHAITDMSSYGRIILSDHLSSSKVELTLYDLEIGHNEVYLGESFKRIILTFMVPMLSNDWIFEDCYLTIETTLQESYEIRLGRLSFYQKSSDYPHMNWSSLDGRKPVNRLRSRLGIIEVSFEGVIPEIEDIEIGTKATLTWTIKEHILTITITDIDYLLYEVPIIITYRDGTKQTISHFRFMIDYIMLKESGPLINVYTLD